MHVCSGQASSIASFVAQRGSFRVSAVRCFCHASQPLYQRASFGGSFGRSQSRRQLLKTSTLALLASWLPFVRMSSDAFQLPGEKWWRSDTVAVVTGANKGIGYGIAKLLAEQGLTTVVACRNEELGRAAVQDLKDSTGSSSLHFMRLDITDSTSVKHFASSLENEFGGVTILVNNAGFAYKGDAFGADEAKQTIDVNYRGTRAVCEAVQPLLTQNARIVNVSSRSGLLKILNSDSLKQRVDGVSSVQEVDALAEEFVQAIKGNKLKESGWPQSMYGVSKLCETAYTRILAEQLKSKGVTVNACCPGYVNTDMTSHRGVKTLAQGADTPVFLALAPSGGPSGKLFAERKVISF